MYKTITLICLFINVVCGIHCRYTVEPISSEKWLQPYSPYYDAESQSLYFCDFFDAQRTLNRFDLIENRFYSAAIEGNISTTFIIPVEKQSSQFAISNGKSVEVIEWNGRDSIAKFVQSSFDIETEPKYKNNNYNMAKASPSHTFYGGTFPFDLCANSASNAALYRFLKEPKAIEENIMVTSGMDWNTETKKFYFIDTCRYEVYEFDWNPETEEIYNKRVAFNFKENGAAFDFPSGALPLPLTIDSDGFLYIGLVYGGAVWKIDPRTSQVAEIIEIPAEIVVGLVFGGEENRTLFVTTGSTAYNFTTGGFSDRTFSSQSGTIFKVNGLNASGYPGRKVLL